MNRRCDGAHRPHFLRMYSMPFVKLESDLEIFYETTGRGALPSFW